MTNEAIILIGQNETDSAPSVSMLSTVDNFPFLHYQLKYLSDNMFKYVVLVINGDLDEYSKIFGDEYLDLKIKYHQYIPELKSGGNAVAALQYISDPTVFILNGNAYFRLNLRKGDDFRRMRDTEILMIGKQMDRTLLFEEIRLNDKGQIKEIANKGKYRGPGAINTGTFLINTRYFKNQFTDKKFSIYDDFFKDNYRDEKLFCLACKQYFIEIHRQEDLEEAKNDIEEYYF